MNNWLHERWNYCLIEWGCKVWDYPWSHLEGVKFGSVGFFKVSSLGSMVYAILCIGFFPQLFTAISICNPLVSCVTYDLYASIMTSCCYFGGAM